jgi:predicted N-acyltransferase
MLHFELCHYRLIEHAIARGIERVEGGAGGAQKIKRGFLPVRTYSAHWIRHRGIGRAIAEYLKEEAKAVDEEIRLAAN